MMCITIVITVIVGRLGDADDHRARARVFPAL
jgi:hypothetical protein